MEGKKPVYSPEDPHQRIVLTPEQKEAVQKLLFEIVEAPVAVREREKENVPKVLENGNPLNRLIFDSEDKIVGFIACRGFINQRTGDRTLFVHALGSVRNTGRDLFKEIPAFLEQVKKYGYKEIAFYGWNQRLNHILERCGFKKDGTRKVEGYEVDSFKKVLS